MKLTFSKKFWWIEIAFLIGIIAFEIASIGTGIWFSQGKGNEKWEGGLLWPKSGNGKYDETSSYKEYWNKCDSGEIDGADFYAYCKSIRIFWAAGATYVIFEVVSMMLCLSAIFVIILDIFNKERFLYLSVFFVWDTVCWHLMAYITWAALTNLVFNENCEELDKNSHLERGNVCGESGAALGLFIVLYTVLIASIHTLVYYFFRRNKTSEEKPDIKEEEKIFNGTVDSKILK